MAAVTGLAIMVKTPGRSPVKTRLAASGLGVEAATRFHLLAAEAVAASARACAPAISPHWAVAEPDALGDPLWRGLPRLAQGPGEGPGGLGARMGRVYHALLERHGRALLVGADSPLLTPALLLSAHDRLVSGKRPFVLDPSTDGGFWLFGGTRPLPPAMWEGVAYSTADTGRDFLAALAPHGDCALLPTLADVDTVDDLAALRHGLAALDAPSPAHRALAAFLAQAWIR